MKLALFDLDNTLLPIDSDHSWSQFLINQNVLEKTEFEAKNDQFFADYKAGTLDIHAFLDFQLKPLKNNKRVQLNKWHAQFMREVIAPNIRDSALRLIQQHKDEHAICLIVTATNRFITEPIAHAFGISEIIATEPEEINGEFTGKVIGDPSFREGKLKRMNQWMASKGFTLDSFESVHFYSDSVNDLPLLEYVSNPVATNPDEKLHAVAIERQWPILELFS